MTRCFVTSPFHGFPDDDGAGDGNEVCVRGIGESGKQFGDKSLRNAGAGLFDRGQRRCEIGSGLDVVESGERNIARNGASGVDDCPFCGNCKFVVVGEHGVRIRI